MSVSEVSFLCCSFRPRGKDDTGGELQCLETHLPISCVRLVNVYFLIYFGGSLCGCLCFLLSSFPFSCPHYCVNQSDITLRFRDGCSLFFQFFPHFASLDFYFSCFGLSRISFVAKVLSPLVSAAVLVCAHMLSIWLKLVTKKESPDIHNQFI